MKLDDVKKLHQKKYRGRLGHYLVEGEHLILELQKVLILSPNPSKISLYITEDYQSWASHLKPVFDIHTVSTKQMMQLSDTRSPQGIIACVPLPELSQVPPTYQAKKLTKERTIYLHEIQDPGNLGTILRTLAWFGGFRLLLSSNSVDPFNSKVVRASMGAIFHVPLEIDVGLNELPARFNQFAYLDLQGQPIQSPDFADFDCYLFGNEARGVPKEELSKCQAQAFTIPGQGQIDSLNLASAVNICTYQLSV
ncbi:TrmH family RNA methyltransferase [Paraglaciecola aestuariivivens]